MDVRPGVASRLPFGLIFGFFDSASRWTTHGEVRPERETAVPADPIRVQTMFLGAVNLADPDARKAYLEQACGEDRELRERVEALLQAHDSPDSLLDEPIVQPANDATGTHPSSNGVDVSLSFLKPPQREGSLGRIGHYEVLEVLGRGGFGIVFRAFDEVLQRVVAVKVLAPHAAATSPARKRFLREARAAAQIKHENVVQVHAVVEEPLPYLVMEFIPGETLQQRMDRTGPLDVPEILSIGRQMAAGLAAAHEKGLVHRDIKPTNILVAGSPDPKVTITDFGLARAADDASLTRSGIVAGTPMFMAPEQAKGKPSTIAPICLVSAAFFTRCAAAGRRFERRGRWRCSNAFATRSRGRSARSSRKSPNGCAESSTSSTLRIATRGINRQSKSRHCSPIARSNLLIIRKSRTCDSFQSGSGRVNHKDDLTDSLSRSDRWRCSCSWLQRRYSFTRRCAIHGWAMKRQSPLNWNRSVRGWRNRNELDHRFNPGSTKATGWIRLFNGKDASGWVERLKSGGWQVTGDGVIQLMGEGAIFTTKDYDDFHLVAEVRVDGDADSGIFFRCDPKKLDGMNPSGFEAMINANDQRNPRTGSLTDPLANYVYGEDPMIGSGQWYTYEVIADGKGDHAQDQRQDDGDGFARRRAIGEADRLDYSFLGKAVRFSSATCGSSLFRRVRLPRSLTHFARKSPLK